jgi:hypothetical protein
LRGSTTKSRFLNDRHMASEMMSILNFVSTFYMMVPRHLPDEPIFFGSVGYGKRKTRRNYMKSCNPLILFWRPQGDLCRITEKLSC